MRFFPSTTCLALSSLALAGCPATELVRTPSPPAAAPSAPDPCTRWPTRLRPPARDPVDPAGAKKAYQTGNAAMERSEWFEAEKAFEQAVNMDGRFGLAHLQLAEVMTHTAAAPERRRTHLAAALDSLPQNPRGHGLFAEALVATGEPAAALLHLRCALDLKPEARGLRRRAARMAMELEGVEAAEALAAPLLEGPTSAQDWLAVADIAAGGENWKAAGRAVEAAAKALGSAPLHRRAADYFRRGGETDLEEAAHNAAERLDPSTERELRPLRPSRRR